jgi:NACHT domain
VAVVLFVVPLLGLLVLRRHHHLDVAVVVAIIFGLVSASLGLPVVWLTWAGVRGPRRSADSVSGVSMDQVADGLAASVGAQWDAEVAVRRLNDPYPLPVSWAAADPSLTDIWDSLVKLVASGVGWPAPPAAGTWAVGPDDLAGEGGDLVKVLTRVPTGRLVVLGEPGAGKTMLMVRLVLDLLARRVGGGPVPFLVSIASWNPAAQDLRDWLGAQLIIDHPALASPSPAGEPTLAAGLLASRLILPILDGLDEIPEQVRGPAISRINDALRPGEQVVVTCRSAEYRDAVRPQGSLGVTLRAAAAVQLHPLDGCAVRDYLFDDAAGPDARARWDPVFAVLGTEAPAGQALSTPLMVGLARAIYNPRPGELAGTLPNPADLCKPGLADREAVESLLFDAFIPAAYRHHTAGRWKAQDVKRWLVFLARHLERTIGSPNLAWWQLPLALPHFGLAAGVATGAVIGVLCQVLLQATGFGGVLGGSTGVAVGVVMVIAVSLSPKQPTIARGIRRQLPSRRNSVLGAGVGITCGVTIGVLSGVLYGVVTGIVSGAVIGVVFSILAVLWVWVMDLGDVPLDLSSAASPRTMLEADRRTGIAVGMAVWAGAIVGVGVAIGTATGTATGVAGGLTVGSAIGIATIFAVTAWPCYGLARIWLALRHRLPRNLMPFLADAHKRGVLRQAGAVYQFRHIELMHRLANTSGEIGSYYDVQDVNGDKYRVTLVKIIDPGRGADEDTSPENGKRFVGAVFTMKALSGSPEDVDPNNDAAVIGSNGQTYSADLKGIAEYTNFGNAAIHLAQGETVMGSVTFQVPEPVEVAKVQWTPAGLGAMVQWNLRH